MNSDEGMLYFIIIFFIFLFINNINQDIPINSIDKQTLSTFQTQLKQYRDELNHSEYESGYGNITGFRLSYGDHLLGKSESDWPIHKFDKDHPWIEDEKYSILPNVISERVNTFWGKDEVVDGDDRAYLLNISGSAYGEFKALKTTGIKPQLLEIPKYLMDYYNSLRNLPDENGENPADDVPEFKQGNITSSNGSISAYLYPSEYNFQDPKFAKYIYDESKDKVDNAVVTHMHLKLSDYKEVQSHSLDFRGVYYQDSGSIVAVTTSAKFSGTYGLSHLTMNEDRFKISKTLFNQLTNLTNIDKDIGLDDVRNQIVKANEQCEYVAYFQLEKTNYSKQELRDIDDELRKPMGKPLPNDIPALEIGQFVLYSPDCGIVLTNRPDSSFHGIRSEISTVQKRKFIFGLVLLYAAQLILIIRQMKTSRTPGQLTVISSVTLFWLMWGDMTLGLSTLFLTSIPSLFLVMCCLLSLIFCACLFEMRFMFFVMNAQVNERGTTWWEILRGGLTRRNTIDAGGDGDGNDSGPIIPMANTPRQPTQPTYEWQNEGTVSNGGLVICICTSIVTMFFIFNAFTWSKTQRKLAEYIGLLIISSYWIPQFLRNTLKNRRESYRWDFIIGISIIRILPILYICLFDNPLRHRFDPHLAIFIATYVALQIVLLMMQSRMGARFWVNDKWLPKAYDYQQIISITDLESGFSSELLTNIKSRQQQLAQEQEPDIMDCECTCPICKDEVLLPILMKRDNLEARSKVKNRQYMITPCHHIFHGECLENWMKYKLQCPVCRESLPPV